MTIIAVASVKGSPGASTLTWALVQTWDRPVIGVEADLSGGCWAVEHGLSSDPGLVSWAASRQLTTWESVAEHAAEIADHRGVVCAPMIPDQVRAAMSVLEERFATWPSEVDVIVDVGRASSDRLPTPLPIADVVVLVCRPVPAQAGPLQVLAERLVERHRNVAIVCVGQRPFDPDEVANVCGVSLLGVIPDDAHAAQRASTGRAPRVYGAAIATIARRLQDLVATVYPTIGVVKSGSGVRA